VVILEKPLHKKHGYYYCGVAVRGCSVKSGDGWSHVGGSGRDHGHDAAAVGSVGVDDTVVVGLHQNSESVDDYEDADALHYCDQSNESHGGDEDENDNENDYSHHYCSMLDAVDGGGGYPVGGCEKPCEDEMQERHVLWNTGVVE